MALATGSYGGLSFGQVRLSDDIEIDTGNLGIVLGGVNEHGLGFELFYSLTVLDDSNSSGGTDNAWETDTIGLFAVYQSSGEIYFKAKAGYGMVNLKVDSIDGDTLTTLSDTAEGFGYGLSLGKMFGDGALELTYYRFADLDGFSDLEQVIEDSLVGSALEGTDVSINSKIEMLNLTYVWTF